MKETGKFDVVLLEMSGDHGITCSNVIDLYGMLAEQECFPIEIGNANGNSFAIGFITTEAADTLDFKYNQESELGQFVSSILNDMEKESEGGTYTFKGLDIWLNRKTSRKVKLEKALQDLYDAAMQVNMLSDDEFYDKYPDISDECANITNGFWDEGIVEDGIVTL